MRLMKVLEKKIVTKDILREKEKMSVIEYIFQKFQIKLNGMRQKIQKQVKNENIIFCKFVKTL